MSSAIKTGFVSTPMGRIHFLEAGKGPALLLLHSNGCSAHEFASALPILSDEFRVIAWDQPGYGDSDRIYRHLSIEDYTTALIGFMDALRLERTVLVGSSVGGLIAVAGGALYPERFEKVIIVEAPMNSPAAWEANWPMVEGLFSVPTQTFEQTAPRFRALTPEFHTRWNMDRNKAGGWTMMDVMWAIREFDARSMLARVAAPAMVLIGSNGPVVPTLAEYQRIMPTALICIMPDCGHFPMIDAPAEFAAHVAAFAGAPKA